MEAEELILTVPELAEIQKVFKEALQQNFHEVEVKVVECPDLRKEPFRMPVKGLGGCPGIADVGGVKYMQPIPQRSRKYDLVDVGNIMGYKGEYSIIGAGAGPFPETGCNCELMANVHKNVDGEIKSVSQTAKILPPLNYNVDLLISSKFAILGNFFASQGLTGPVLEVKVKRRTGEENFITCMRKALAARFGGQPVGIGGVFVVPSGKLKIHIMPDFADTPLKNETDVNNWLKFFDFPAPMVFYSVFVSEDPGYDLRLEHTHGHALLDESGHCSSNHGGHYHYDTTPDEVEYWGYFSVAEKLFRIDRPSPTENLTSLLLGF
ncbi:ester hydrolase C11orf54 homolog [Paramacrobiotus metropolitanus]|uniref:ester hydrolase C11orf54 homolog n=1 Tax=Paramacrobiotus metropolitanus TaxID=2943436 RepID=UPI0024457EB3|nr:ester hydrolase C11orf54 homolog [Paramacrobiotus metropolitanus]